MEGQQLQQKERKMYKMTDRNDKSLHQYDISTIIRMTDDFKKTVLSNLSFLTINNSHCNYTYRLVHPSTRQVSETSQIGHLCLLTIFKVDLQNKMLLQLIEGVCENITSYVY